jgi:hypothetical protein
VSGADWQAFYVSCPAGKKVLGGSVYSTTGLQRGLAVASEYPTNNNTGWLGVLTETIEQPNTWTGVGTAICANVN